MHQHASEEEEEEQQQQKQEVLYFSPWGNRSSAFDQCYTHTLGATSNYSCFASALVRVLTGVLTLTYVFDDVFFDHIHTAE